MERSYNGKPIFATAGWQMLTQTLVCSPSGCRCNDMHSNECLCDAQGTCSAEKALSRANKFSKRLNGTTSNIPDGGKF